jgi:hypothetical protein
MPNQRKKGKTKVGLWVDESQDARLRELAEQRGMSVSDLIKEAIRLYDLENNQTEKKA